jgi:ubiquinone/menaquinone biosynthesis C-methylase UbiE
VREGKQALATRYFFDREAASWSSEYRPSGHMADRIERFLTTVSRLCPSPGEVLDFGCGSGEIAAALADCGWRVAGRDLSPMMIETARTKWPDRSIEWGTLEPTADLPFANGRFDIAISSSVLEYLQDLPAHLSQIARVVRPGGWYLATVPDMRHPARAAEARKLRFARNPVLNVLTRLTPWRSTYEYLRLSINRHPLSEWADLFRSAGFDPMLPERCEHPLALIAAQKRTAS